VAFNARILKKENYYNFNRITNILPEKTLPQQHFTNNIKTECATEVNYLYTCAVLKERG
jgi:hypothetical protein